MSEQTGIHAEEWSGWQSAVCDDLVRNVNQKICERRRFTISKLSCEFLQISCTVLYEMITVGLSQILRKMGSENADGCVQNA
jgi:hypothetical protein